jgi:hypothetical protein
MGQGEEKSRKGSRRSNPPKPRPFTDPFRCLVWTGSTLPRPSWEPTSGSHGRILDATVQWAQEVGKDGIMPRARGRNQKSGGRFLKQVSGGVWEVGSDTLAREKISQTFRTTRSVIKKREVVDGGQKKDPNGFRESGHEETGKRVRQD